MAPLSLALLISLLSSICYASLASSPPLRTLVAPSLPGSPLSSSLSWSSSAVQSLRDCLDDLHSSPSSARAALLLAPPSMPPSLRAAVAASLLGVVPGDLSLLSSSGIFLSTPPSPERPALLLAAPTTLPELLGSLPCVSSRAVPPTVYLSVSVDASSGAATLPPPSQLSALFAHLFPSPGPRVSPPSSLPRLCLVFTSSSPPTPTDVSIVHRALQSVLDLSRPATSSTTPPSQKGARSAPSPLTLTSAFSSVDFVTLPGGVGTVPIPAGPSGSSEGLPSLLSSLQSGCSDPSYRRTLASFTKQLSAPSLPFPQPTSSELSLLTELSSSLCREVSSIASPSSPPSSGVARPPASSLGSFVDDALARHLARLPSDLPTTDPKVSLLLIRPLAAATRAAHKTISRRAQSDAFASFKSSVSKVRLTPSLSSDVSSLASKNAEDLKVQLSSLVPNHPLLSSGVSRSLRESASALRGEHSDAVRRLADELLIKAQASPSYPSSILPKLNLSLGLHWMLPTPFGEWGRDKRQRAAVVDPSRVIFVPEKKRAEVDKWEVLKRLDWKEKITQSPGLGKDAIVYDRTKPRL